LSQGAQIDAQRVIMPQAVADRTPQTDNGDTIHQVVMVSQTDVPHKKLVGSLTGLDRNKTKLLLVGISRRPRKGLTICSLSTWSTASLRPAANIGSYLRRFAN